MQWTVDLVDAQPADHILEIGCGPGHAVALICHRLTSGTITAIDRSATAVARSRARSAGCIAAGRARIEQQTLTNADLGRRFAKAFAINVNAFWTDPRPSLVALSALLERSGVAYLIYEPPSMARLLDLQARLTAALGQNGFEIVDVHVKPFRPGHGLGIICCPRPT